MKNNSKTLLSLLLVLILSAGGYYLFWLYSEPSQIFDFTLCVDQKGNYIVVEKEELSECRNLKNISLNHFTFSKDKRAFKSRYQPFAKVSELDTLNFSVFLDLDQESDNSKIHNELADYEQSVNIILDYLYSGIRIEFDTVLIVKTKDTLEINKLNTSPKSLTKYLNNTGFAKGEFKNAMIVSEKLKFSGDAFNEAESNLYFHNKQAIFGYSILLNNPYLFIHELFHYSSKKYEEHDDDPALDCGESFGARSIMYSRNTPCMIFYNVKNILEYNSSYRLDSLGKIAWPIDADKICCPYIYDISSIEMLPILFMHLKDLFIALDKQGPYYFFESALAVWSENFVIEDAFLNAVQIESEKVGIDYTEEYGHLRLDTHKEFLQRNAKAGLNHLLEKSYDTHNLNDLSLERLIREYHAENKNDPKTNEAFLKLPMCNRNNCERTDNVNITTGLKSNGKLITFEQVDPNWKLKNNPYVKDDNFRKHIKLPNAYRIKKHSNTVGWNIINGSAILSASKQTNIANQVDPPIWKFERTICVCQEGTVNLKGAIRADDSGVLKLYEGKTNRLIFSKKTTGKHFLNSTYFNRNLDLKEGSYRFVFELKDNSGVATGFAVNASISSSNLIFSNDACCSK